MYNVHCIALIVNVTSSNFLFTSLSSSRLFLSAACALSSAICMSWVCTRLLTISDLSLDASATRSRRRRTSDWAWSSSDWTTIQSRKNERNAEIKIHVYMKKLVWGGNFYYKICKNFQPQKFRLHSCLFLCYYTMYISTPSSFCSASCALPSANLAWSM